MAAVPLKRTASQAALWTRTSVLALAFLERPSLSLPLPIAAGVLERPYVTPQETGQVQEVTRDPSRSASVEAAALVGLALLLVELGKQAPLVVGCYLS